MGQNFKWCYYQIITELSIMFKQMRMSLENKEYR